MHRFCILLVLLALCSCLDEASVSNDQSAAGGGNGGTGGASAGSGASGRGVTSGSGGMASAGTSGSGAGAGGTNGGTGGMASAGAGGSGGMHAAGAGGTGTAGTGFVPMPELVAGTAIAAMCSSYEPPVDGKCEGYYCGVTLETLTLAIDPMALCGNRPDLICSNTVTKKVASCARELKSAMPLVSSADLRTMIQGCVYQDPELQADVSMQCLSCYLDGAICASEHCLFQCLTGDSANCDSCRKTNNCDVPAFACGGIASPF